MSIKNEIKSIIVKEGMTMTEVAAELNKLNKSKNYSLQNLSNKLRRGTLKYKEAKDIAKVLGYEIKWVKKKK